MSRIFSSAEPDPQLTWTAMTQLQFLEGTGFQILEIPYLFRTPLL
jgi:hypothetical protein